ncbi:hypothetical protein ACLB2K_012124 [Fragaria x ananassa]
MERGYVLYMYMPTFNLTRVMLMAQRFRRGWVYSEVKHIDARAIPGWVTYWEAAPELPETKPGFGGDRYSEVKHVDARAIPGWVTYWEVAPELPKTKP